MIGNKNGDFQLACMACGIRAELMQVAHRNIDGFIVGYLFLCGACQPIVSGHYKVFLQHINEEHSDRATVPGSGA